jgi:hypothetical protein
MGAPLGRLETPDHAAVGRLRRRSLPALHRLYLACLWPSRRAQAHLDLQKARVRRSVNIVSSLSSAAPSPGKWRAVAKVPGIVDVVGSRRRTCGALDAQRTVPDAAWKDARALCPRAPREPSRPGSRSTRSVPSAIACSSRRSQRARRRSPRSIAEAVPVSWRPVLRTSRAGSPLPPFLRPLRTQAHRGRRSDWPDLRLRPPRPRSPRGRVRTPRAGGDIGVEAIGFVPAKLSRRGAACLADLGASGSPTSGSDSC